MALTAAQLKSHILRSLAQTPTSPLSGEVDVLWEMCADRQRGDDLLLQHAACRILAIEWLRDNKHLYHQVSEQGVSEALNQVFQNLDTSHKSAITALQSLELRYANRRAGGAIARITQRTPVKHLTSQLNPSDRVYRGDALRRAPLAPGVAEESDGS